MVCADLSASHSSHLWCSDATADKVAGCWADCSEGEHRALWARRDRRGHYTWLSKGATRWLARRAQTSVLQDYWEKVGSVASSPQRVLIETFDFLAVCCGARGVLPAPWQAPDYASALLST